MTFPELDACLRTDENFAPMTDSDRHKCLSRLVKRCWPCDSICLGFNASRLFRGNEEVNEFVAKRTSTNQDRNTK